MQVSVDLKFDDLLKAVATLPAGKLKQLRAEIDKHTLQKRPTTKLEEILLQGPIASEEELAIIAENRKAINQWRKK